MGKKRTKKKKRSKGSSWPLILSMIFMVLVVGSAVGGAVYLIRTGATATSVTEFLSTPTDPRDIPKKTGPASAASSQKIIEFIERLKRSSAGSREFADAVDIPESWFVNTYGECGSEMYSYFITLDRQQLLQTQLTIGWAGRTGTKLQVNALGIRDDRVRTMRNRVPLFEAEADSQGGNMIINGERAELVIPRGQYVFVGSSPRYFPRGLFSEFPPGLLKTLRSGR